MIVTDILRLQDSFDVLKYFVQILCSVYRLQDSSLLIILDQRLGLVMIYRQTFLNCLWLVIVTQYQLLAACVTDTFYSGRIVNDGR